MSTPLNPAAEQIVRAPATIADQITQQAELQKSISRNQDLIEQLAPHATWGESTGEHSGTDEVAE